MTLAHRTANAFTAFVPSAFDLLEQSGSGLDTGALRVIASEPEQLRSDDCDVDARGPETAQQREGERSEAWR